MLVEKSQKNQLFNGQLGENVTCNQKMINRADGDGDWNFARYTTHRIRTIRYHINIPKKSFHYSLSMTFTWISKIAFFSWRKKGDRSITFNWICNGKIKPLICLVDWAAYSPKKMWAKSNQTNEIGRCFCADLLQPSIASEDLLMWTILKCSQ